MKKISPAQTKSYESVKNEIRKELLENKTIDQQYELASTVEDMLAGGASLEEVKKNVDIETLDLPSMNKYGQAKDRGDTLKNYEKSKKFILENGFSLHEGETSQMSEIDGSFIAVHVDSIQPKIYTPFEQVKSSIAKKWMDDQKRMENKIQVAEALKEIQTGKTNPADFAKMKNKELQSKNNVSRRSPPAKPLNERSWANLFEAAPNEPFVLDIDGGTAIAWVTKAALPEKINTGNEDFKKFRSGLLAATQNEAMRMYNENKRAKYGAAVNKQLLDRAYGQANESN